jgi:hypothetical protein
LGTGAGAADFFSSGGGGGGGGGWGFDGSDALAIGCFGSGATVRLGGGGSSPQAAAQSRRIARRGFFMAVF